MSNQSALKEMGVINPKEITNYSLRQEGRGDVLKIYYKRKKGSFLPSSRKYKFGRSSRMVVADSGKQEYKDIYEISPFLRKAVAELDAIVKLKEDVTDSKKRIIEEMEHLEKTVANKLRELRKQLEKL